MKRISASRRTICSSSIVAAVSLERLRLDGQKVVHPRRFQKFELHPRDHEKQGVAVLAGMDRALVNVEFAQHFGAGALDEAQIIGVIDKAGEIRVLEIDADGEEMAAVVEGALGRHGSGRHGSDFVF